MAAGAEGRRQRSRSPRRGIRAGRHTVVGQTVPAGQFEHRQPRRDKGQRGHEARHALPVAHDVDQRLVCRRFLRDRRGRECLIPLGDAIEARKSDWILAFEGRSLDDPGADGWAVRKDGGAFDAFTGATITPRAVVAAVHEGLRYFRVHSGEMLARIPDPATNAVTGG